MDLDTLFRDTQQSIETDHATDPDAEDAVRDMEMGEADTEHQASAAVTEADSRRPLTADEKTARNQRSKLARKTKKLTARMEKTTLGKSTKNQESGSKAPAKGKKTSAAPSIAGSTTAPSPSAATPMRQTPAGGQAREVTDFQRVLAEGHWLVATKCCLTDADLTKRVMVDKLRGIATSRPGGLMMPKDFNSFGPKYAAGFAAESDAASWEGVRIPNGNDHFYLLK